MLLSLPHPSLYFPSKTETLKPLLLPRSSLSPPPSTKPPESAPNSAIQRISEKLRNLGYLDPNSNPNPIPNPHTSAGEIFIPTPHELPRHRVGHTIDSSWSTPENPVPAPGTGIARFRELWKEEREEKKGEERVPTVAELTIPVAELKRLRREGIRLERRLKVGKAGVTEGIVNGIHERWRRSEMVKIKCEDLCRLNMKRTHEILERKTGGLVVWRSGSIIILYRGVDYKYPYFSDEGQPVTNLHNISEDPSIIKGASVEQEETVSPGPESPNTSSRPSLVIGVGSPNKVRLQLSGEVQIEEEVDKLLDGLGPRFIDWWGYEPLPVDADLLPPIVPGFRRPFRLLPYGIKSKLTDREMTILRRLSRPLPCHFALGRNRNLQGLAVSMIKLWEKCEVAKIAVKRGVQNTNSEIMVEELKRLTGGTLLSRDKDFISFYRGKDFLPSAVSTAIEERRNSEVGRQKQNNHIISSIKTTTVPLLRFERPAFIDEPAETTEQTRPLTKERRSKTSNLAIKRVENKLSLALEKKEKAEKLLAELEDSVEPLAIEPDKEAITEEERYMLRKVALRMKPFLLLGRRGVFAGTVENMHLHWKYRELVKIISKDKSIEHVESAARTLEMESGGILVAVERVSKGHAIIMYRGKNYRRPSDLRPKTLLNKKEAMKRSLEAQRRESLKLHVLSLSQDINRLQHQMLTESNKSNSEDEIKKRAESPYSQENTESSIVKEVIEASTEYLHLSNHEEEESTIISSTTVEMPEADVGCLSSDKHGSIPNEKEQSTLSSNNIIEATYSINLGQDSQIAPEHEHVDELSENEDVLLSTDSTDNTHVRDIDAGCIYNERSFYPESSMPSDQASMSTTSDLSQFSDEEESQDLEIPFRAAPLSNRERLILRKQALKMRKRPVLAVGRNNIVTGVAKTIKTHFKKHALAIVNIKGRAEGTSVQEVIFKLEQATGAVLVSTEPNKVILYRGWGEGEEQPQGVGNQNDTKCVKKGSESTNEEESVLPKLIEAIRVECGLSG